MSRNDWRWYVLDINPSQWAIGPIHSGRKGGKLQSYVGRNAELHAYQSAVKELLGQEDTELLHGPVELRMYLWRRRDEYVTPQARTHRKHEADLTNLQKALEDAIQKVLFENDKDTKAVRVVIVEQGADTRPAAVIAVRPYPGFDPSEIPDHVWARLGNIWQGDIQATLDTDPDRFSFMNRVTE